MMDVKVGYSREEEKRRLLQRMFWDRFLEYVFEGSSQGHILWREFLGRNGISVLPGVDFSDYSDGRFVALACPVIPNCSILVPRDFADKALVLGLP